MNVTSFTFSPAYSLLVLLALALGMIFPVAKHISDRNLRRKYHILQAITLLGAIVGAKVVVLIGDYHWPLTPLAGWRTIIFSGRSLVGGLIFGFLAAETAKPLLGYSLPPNDHFAALLPFTIAIGRVGCLLGGCCRGIPYNGMCSIVFDDGIPRHPAQIYEIIFHLTAGVLFVYLVKTKHLFGHLFSIYLMAYGIFRFLTEFIRDTPKTYGALSAYQLFSVLMVLLGAGFLLKRTLSPPLSWKNSVRKRCGLASAANVQEMSNAGRGSFEYRET